MEAVFFKSQAEFRKWLELNHRIETELLVGFFKVDSGRLNMTWSQSVDEALCFGWIDGIRRSIDSKRYCIRFTPRKPTSTWSKINISKVEELQKKGLMKQAGIDVYENRKKSRSGIYSFENGSAKLNKGYETLFKSNKSAWDYFSRQAPSYQRNVLHWIMSARQEETQLRRLTKAILQSDKQNHLF